MQVLRRKDSLRGNDWKRMAQKDIFFGRWHCGGMYGKSGTEGNVSRSGSESVE